MGTTMTRTLRAIRWLLDVALLLLVGTVIGLVLAAQIGPKLGHQPIIIEGGSMAPAIPLGALVDVVQVQPADLAAGDVVTFESANGVLVTHRITRVVSFPDGLYIETQGDANESPDPVLLPASAVKGRVDFSLPLLGFLMFMLTTLAGFASIVCLALTLLIAAMLLEDLEKEDREDREGRDDGIDAESKPAELAGPWSDLIG
jgi:signal peptidase